MPGAVGDRPSGVPRFKGVGMISIWNFLPPQVSHQAAQEVMMRQQAQYLLVVLEPVDPERLQQLLDALAQWMREHPCAAQVPHANGHAAHTDN